MRYVVAIASLVVAGLLLLLGIGQRSFLAGPTEIVQSAKVSNTVGYGYIAADDLAAVPGQAQVRVSGDDPVVVAYGTEADVSAWVAPFDHETFGVTRGAEKLDTAVVRGVTAEPAEPAEGDAPADDEAAALAAIDPRGSDLWREEFTNDAALSVPLDLPKGSAVLIASDGTAPLPKNISVAWIQDRSTPLAGPFLAAGGLFALLGAVLYLLAIDHDRRGVGPRRGNRGPLAGIRSSLRRGPKRTAPGATDHRAAPAAPGPDAASPDAANPNADDAESVGPDSDGPEAAGQDAAGHNAAGHNAAGQDAQAPESSAPEAGGTVRRTRVQPRRGLALGAIGLGLTLGLSGCSADYWPSMPNGSTATPTVTETAEDLPPIPVTDSQIDRILDDVVTAAATADAANSASGLDARFAGTALEQRTANYTIAAAGVDYPKPPTITDKRLAYELIQSTESWPRTLFISVDSTVGPEPDPAEADAEAEADAPKSPSLALVLTQNTPHENFHVQNVIEVRGGTNMPTAAPASDGTARLSPELKTLRLAPGQVGAAYADVLQNGGGSSFAELFDLENDVLSQSVGRAWVEKMQAQADADKSPVTHSVEVSQNGAEVIALSTGAGGALVSVTVDERQIGKTTKPLEKVKVQPAVAALSGLTESQPGIYSLMQHQMLFFVPNADSSDPIRVLGSTTQMTGAGKQE